MCFSLTAHRICLLTITLDTGAGFLTLLTGPENNWFLWAEIRIYLLFFFSWLHKLIILFSLNLVNNSL